MATRKKGLEKWKGRPLGKKRNMKGDSVNPRLVLFGIVVPQIFTGDGLECPHGKGQEDAKENSF